MRHFMGFQVENGEIVARIRNTKNHTFVWTPHGFDKKPNFAFELHNEASLAAHGIEMEELQLLPFQDEHGYALKDWVIDGTPEKTVATATITLAAGAHH